MERVLVIGCSGAGKTHFSLRLAEKTGLPLVHLDEHFWQAGWVAREPKDWRQRISALMAEPRWIMDGNYTGSLEQRLPAADTVFFLDLPRRVSLISVILRTIASYGRTRYGVAAGCGERFELEFFAFIWNFHRIQRPRLTAALKNFGGKVVTFRSRAEIEAWLA